MGTNAEISATHRWRLGGSRPAGTPTENKTPDRLVGRYVIGLAAIAVLAIASSLAVGLALARQESDARVVNLAAGQVISSFELEQAVGSLALSTSDEERAVALASLRSVKERMDPYPSGIESRVGVAGAARRQQRLGRRDARTG